MVRMADRKMGGLTMTENKILSVDLCKDTLEISIGEVDTYIPKQVIESTLYYLKEYERLKSLQSWSDFPESMGR